MIPHGGAGDPLPFARSQIVQRINTMPCVMVAAIVWVAAAIVAHEYPLRRCRQQRSDHAQRCRGEIPADPGHHATPRLLRLSIIVQIIAISCVSDVMHHALPHCKCKMHHSQNFFGATIPCNAFGTLQPMMHDALMANGYTFRHRPLCWQARRSGARLRCFRSHRALVDSAGQYSSGSMGNLRRAWFR